MKKSLFILAVLTVMALPSYATLTTDEAISQEYIRNHGYSTEMARLIDLQNSQINNTPTKFKPTLKDRWYKKHVTNERLLNVCRHLDVQEPEGKYTKEFFRYFDPATDDGMFMRNEIFYDNHYDDL